MAPRGPIELAPPVERAFLLAVDTGDDPGWTAEDSLANMTLINEELAAFGHGLAEKPQLVALNKVDEPGAEELAESLAATIEARGLSCLVISAQQRRGTDELARRAFWLLQQERAGVKIEVPEAELKAAIERDGK